MANLPLHSAWRLFGELPDDLAGAQAPASFILPGAKALEDFAGLLGDDGGAPDDAPEQSIPFPLPAMLPDDVTGEAELRISIDFGRLFGDRAVLTFDALCGEGDVLLDGEVVASFGHAPYDGPLSLTRCALAVDLTDALHLGRRQTLALRFGEKRPAGVPGPVTLRTVREAMLRRIAVVPKASERTLVIRAEIEAFADGPYLLEAQPSNAPAVAVSLRIGEGMTREIEMSVPMPGKLFAPGAPYDAPALKLSLYRRSAPHDPQAKKPRKAFSLFAKKTPGLPAFAPMKGVLCDSAALMVGYPGDAPRAWVPLTEDDCLHPDPALADNLHALGVTGVSLPCPAADALYRALTRLGIGVRQSGASDEAALSRYPCVTFTPAKHAALSPAMTAWQLGGVTGQMRVPDPDADERDLLAEAFGKSIDPDAPGVRDVLHWLRAVHVRLLCEAARQGRYTGALCNPGERQQSDVAESLKTALAPTHVGVLPLLGAWWAGSGFSASVCAFTGGNYGASLTAEVALEGEDGEILARESYACPPRGGMLGVLRAQLPDRACVLTLHARLMSGKTVIEENVLPVYVGIRGPLEAALT